MGNKKIKPPHLEVVSMGVLSRNSYSYGIQVWEFWGLNRIFTNNFSMHNTAKNATLRLSEKTAMPALAFTSDSNVNEDSIPQIT